MEHVLYVLRRPALLARSLLAMYVLMPIVAVALAVAFDLIPSVEIALLALAVSPVPPLLPPSPSHPMLEPTVQQASAATAYSMNLMVFSALIFLALPGRP